MKLYILKSRPMLIFLMSATAVSFNGIRMADLAFFIFGLTLIVSGCKLIIDRLSFALSMLLATVFLSTSIALILGGEIVVSNAVAVPAGVFISLLCLIFIKPVDVLEIIHGYPFFLIFFTLLVGLAKLLGVDIPWIVYDEEMDRFSGLSQNPNQLALYLLPIPFFSLVSYLKNRKSKWQISVEIIAAILINLFVLGKTLFVGWLISFAFLFLIGFVYVGNLRVNLLNIILKLSFLCLAVFALLPMIFALYRGDTAGSVEGQGDDRLALWRNGLHAWFDSFLFGHGPGHYSGVEAVYQNMEAHNFWIDWLSAYGFIGGCALFLYLLLNLMKIMSTRSWIIASLYISLFIQTTFHFYGRQPFFWMLLVIGYLSASELARKKSKV